MKKLYLVLICLMVIGCTMEGAMDKSSKNRFVTCTDTRDGEVFTFYSNDITNVIAGIGVDSSFDIVDNNGVPRTLSSSMDVYLKCEGVKVEL